MYKKISVALISAAAISGCNFFKANDKPEVQPVKPGAAEAPVKNCANGQPPQIVKGSCAGHWVISKSAENKSCEFMWGPTIKCPEGMSALKYEAVCYGSTAKPITSDQKINSAEDCAKTFGQYPVSPDYELQCCPI